MTRIDSNLPDLALGRLAKARYVNSPHPQKGPRMHPGLVAFSLAMALAAAASVPLIWWLGVWGWLKTLGARQSALEMSTQAEIEGFRLAIQALQRRRASEDGVKGRAKQAEEKAALDDLVQQAQAELATLPPKKGGKLKMAPEPPAAEAEVVGP